MEKSWTVVKFNDEDSVEAVPTTWIIGKKCYWPPFPQAKILIAIKNHEVPNTCWPCHDVSIFRNGTFDNYLEARRKSKIAECQSDLLSEEDSLKQRKIRNRKVISLSSEEEEIEMLKDPPLQKQNIGLSRTDEASSCDQESNKFSFGTDSNDVVLKTLLADFNSFSIQCLRKQNIICSIVTDLVTEITHLKEALKDLGVTKKIVPNENNSLDKLGLPATNQEDMVKLENHLLIEENFLSAVKELSKVGGNSSFEFIKRVMLQLMTYNIATLYTWHGTKEKIAFKNTTVSKVILRASEGISNKKQTEEALQNFFRRAKERSKLKNTPAIN